MPNPFDVTRAAVEAKRLAEQDAASADSCTDPDNCGRCLTPVARRTGDMWHAGISMAQLAKQSAPQPVISLIKTGDYVKVTSGPLKGLTGRVICLAGSYDAILDSPDRDRSVNVSLSTLELVHSSSVSQCALHPRYSTFPFCPDCRANKERAQQNTPSGGGKLSGKHYYRVDVPHPISPELQSYAAECADIIEALGMTFNEGEAFKALWRLAAARQGRAKQEGKAQYDADKAAHYAARVAVQEKQRADPA